MGGEGIALSTCEAPSFYILYRVPKYLDANHCTPQWPSPGDDDDGARAADLFPVPPSSSPRVTTIIAMVKEEPTSPPTRNGGDSSSFLWRCLRSGAWPFANLIRMSQVVFMGTTSSTITTPEKPPKPDLKPIASWDDHIMVILGTTPRCVLGVLSWLALDLKACATYQWQWILHVFLRDLLLAYIVAGGWDWLLYSPHSPMNDYMRTKKYNPR